VLTLSQNLQGKLEFFYWGSILASKHDQMFLDNVSLTWMGFIVWGKYWWWL